MALELYRRCDRCRKPILESAQFCAHCGVRQSISESTQVEPRWGFVCNSLVAVAITVVTLPFAVFAACSAGMLSAGVVSVPFFVMDSSKHGTPTQVGTVLGPTVGVVIFAGILVLWAKGISKLFKQ